ncbi:MAG: roadblock/LC7 domain-containing protein [Methanocaldococcus sp.]
MKEIENCNIDEINKIFQHLSDNLNIEGFAMISKDSFIKVGDINKEDLDMISKYVTVIMGSSEMLYDRFNDEVEHIEIKGKKHKTIIYNLGNFAFVVFGNIEADEIENTLMELKFKINGSNAENIIEEIALS